MSATFSQNPYPDVTTKNLLAEQLGVNRPRVSKWFQHRRESATRAGCFQGVEQRARRTPTELLVLNGMLGGRGFGGGVGGAVGWLAGWRAALTAAAAFFFFSCASLLLFQPYLSGLVLCICWPVLTAFWLHVPLYHALVCAPLCPAA